MSLTLLGAIEMRKRTKLDGLAVYLGSLRAVNPHVRMVLFNRSPNDAGLRKLLNRYHAESIDAVAFDKGYDIPPVEIEIARFLQYGAWLETNPCHRVLMTDVLDVVWQDDPEDDGFGDQIVAWQENRQIADCRYNRKWVRECWPLSFTEMLDKPIVCCGVLAAGYHAALRYLGWYRDQLTSRPLDHVRRGFDSAMANGYRDLAQVAYANTVCMHLGYAPQADVTYDRAVSCAGRTPMIVHQYNRHPEVTRSLYERWT